MLTNMENKETHSESEEETSLLLQNLPTDILLSIFDYCDYCDLIQLSFLCKRFHSMMKDETVWRQKSLFTLVTNLHCDEMKKRFCFDICSREKVRLSCNWTTARFKEHVKLYLGDKYMPWLCLGNDHLWISKGNAILAFKRRRKGCHLYLDQRLSVSLNGHSEDICRFVYREGIIVSGGSNNSIYGFYGDGRTRKPMFHNDFAHYSEVTAVDMRDQTIISGSTDKTVKVWQINERSNSDEWGMTAQTTINVRDSIRSVSMRPNAEECFIGSAGFSGRPLHLYNIQRGVEVMNFKSHFRHGAGVLDLNWETPDTIMTTGYDTYVRLWDCRTGKNELSWGDPFDSAIYCLASDNLYTILTGTCNHGRVQLWDKRHPCSIQMFFLSSKYNRRSSVYSLAFDPCNLYAALEQTLNILDFAGYGNKPKDFWHSWMRIV